MTGLAIVVLAVGGYFGCNALRRQIVAIYPQSYSVKGNKALAASFDGKDADRRRIDVRLTEVAKGFTELIGIELVPGQPDVFVALEKGGTAYWHSLSSGQRGELFQIDVLTVSEEGLLGIAFHPRYRENGRFFIHYVAEDEKGRHMSRVDEYTVPAGADLTKAKKSFAKRIFQVEQPYPNHNGGHLAFGPDGFLYIGYGDGGFANDPHGHGQNLSTYLGAMLRIDVDRSSDGRPYAIPPDNPFAGRPDALPEIFAYGLRNPWRYAFDPKGRLVAGDVGQDRYEEITYVGRGDNLGWNVREARHCFEPEQGCRTEGLVDPFYEYGREEGQSVTGGVVYTGTRLPALKGKYVFGDFVTGRLWALDLPEPSPKPPLVEAYALGKWPILPTSFARDEQGEVYVCDFNDGKVFRLDPP